jgi:hypothetical protein
VALSGRVLASMLAGQGMGLGLNLDVAPSSILIPALAVTWLAKQLAQVPEEIMSRVSEFRAPVGLPEPVIAALARKLSTAAGLAQTAYIVGTVHEDRSEGYLLGFIDAVPEVHAALAKAAGEALAFSGLEDGGIDVGFFAESDPATAKLARFGLRFDLRQPAEPEIVTPVAPGSDPDKPPMLR